MQQIRGVFYIFFSSILNLSLVAVIIFGLRFGYISLKIYIQAKKNKNCLLELLNYLKNHKDPNIFDKIIKLLQQNEGVINFAHGSLQNTLFLSACEQGATKVVQEMLKLGADINYTNYEGNGAMYLAVYYLCKNQESNDATLIRTLYYCNCDVNIENKKGYTPLHLAAYYGHIPLINWLLTKGAYNDIPPLPAGLALANRKYAAAYLLFTYQYENKF